VAESKESRHSCSQKKVRPFLTGGRAIRRRLARAPGTPSRCGTTLAAKRSELRRLFASNISRIKVRTENMRRSTATASDHHHMPASPLYPPAPYNMQQKPEGCVTEDTARMFDCLFRLPDTQRPTLRPNIETRDKRHGVWLPQHVLHSNAHPCRSRASLFLSAQHTPPR
jgi:hypothetical protein